MPDVADSGRLLELLRAAGEVYIAGGWVRDAQLASRPRFHDFDLVVESVEVTVAAIESEFARLHPQAKKIKRVTHAATCWRENVVKLQIDHLNCQIDIAEPTDGDLVADARRRDFTINALYHCLRTDQLIDPLGLGLPDLNNRLLRACSPTSISTDPVRILRAARLICMYPELIIEETTKAWLLAPENIEALCLTSPPERVRNEFCRILNTQQPERAFRFLPAPVLQRAVDLFSANTKSAKEVTRRVIVEAALKRKPQAPTLPDSPST